MAKRAGPGSQKGRGLTKKEAGSYSKGRGLGGKGDEDGLRRGEGRGCLERRRQGPDSEKKEWGVLAPESSGRV